MTPREQYEKETGKPVIKTIFRTILSTPNGLRLNTKRQTKNEDTL